MIRLSLLPITRFRRLGEFDNIYDRLLSISLVVGSVLVSIVLAYVLVDISPALAVTGVLAIPVGILVITRPDIGLLLIIFGIPLSDFNKLGNGGPSVLELLFLPVLGGAAAHFFIFRRRDSLVGAWQNWLIAFFLLAVILSNFVAIDPSKTLEGTLRVMRILTLYFLIINVIRSERDLKRLLWVTLIASSLSVVYGLLNPEQHVIGRFSGTMAHPNALAIVLAGLVPLALALLIAEKGHSKRVLLLAMVGVMVYGLTLTGSRGGLLAAGFGLLLFTLLQKRKIIALVLVGLIVVAGVTVMPLEMKKRVGLVEASADDHLGTDTDRRESYQIFGWQLWREHPILGIGLDSFGEAYSRSTEYRFFQKGRNQRLAHNTYLEILVGTGLVGFIPFASLLGLSLVKAWKFAGFRDRYPYLGNVSVGLFAGQAAFFLNLAVITKQHDKTLWLLMATVVVIQVLIKAAERQELSLTTNQQPDSVR